MAGFAKPRIRTGRSLGQTQVVDPSVRINKILEAGFNVFELRHRKSSPYNRVIMGFDDVRVELVTSLNNSEIRYSTSVVPGSALSFEPDQENILYAYLPDTEKNRRLLAKQIYSCEWNIVQLITPSGNISAVKINEEINKIAKHLGVEKPLPITPTDLRIKGKRNRANDVFDALNSKEKEELQKLLAGKISKETEKVNIRAVPEIQNPETAAVPPPGRVRKPSQFPAELPPVQEIKNNVAPEPMTKDQVVDQVLNENSALVSFLKKKSPTGWKSTSEYREVLAPQINELMAAQSAPAQVDNSQAAQGEGTQGGVPGDLAKQLQGA